MTPELDRLAGRVVGASRVLAGSPGPARDAALAAGAAGLEAHCDDILAANAADLDAAAAEGAGEATLDRLRLSPERVQAMASGLRTVAALDDPVGETIRGWVRPNGLEIREVRVPLGVVGVIYENRPNVTSDAAGLCLKSANVAFLRGSAAALRSNQAIVSVLRAACEHAGLPADSVTLLADTSRASAVAFMRMDGVIDCLIPRGGRSLIDEVRRSATVPYVLDGDGNCHVYVDGAADLGMATSIVVNGKTQRPGVCNATESLLVHAAVAEAFLPGLADALDGVVLRGDEATCRILGPRAEAASDEDWGREYLDRVLSVRVVACLEEAFSHIARYGTGHTEAIVTSDRDAARRFQRSVDAAAVVVNASTRFTDGGEWGYGAEIGISTQKLHARGPMGLRALTTVKYLVEGNGQVR